MSSPSTRPTPATVPDVPPRRRHPVVLFDLDGTLIDSLELLVGAMTHAFDSREGPRPTVEQWVATIGRPLMWQFGQYATGEDDLQQLVRSYRAFQYEHHDRLTRTFDGIPALIERLRTAGHPLGVVTSKADHLANRSLTYVGLAPSFDVVVGADRTTKHKPDPDPLWFALAALDDRPDRAVYIGDSPFDIMAGNAAGTVTIGVTWGAATHHQLLEASPTHVVSSVGELDTLLAKLGSTLAT